MDIKRSYYEDISLFPGKTVIFWSIVLIAALIVLPFLVPGYVLSDVNYIAIHIIVAVGLNILVGYTGQVSLGHAGFFAIGAYGTVILFTNISWMPFLPALVIAGFIAALFGFILGIPSLRLEGPYLAIATLGFGLAVVQIIGRFGFFGGHNGLSVPEPGMFKGALVSSGLVFSSDAASVELYLIVMPIAVILTILARNIIRSRIGRAFIAIRDDDIAAQAMGVNLTYYKTLAFSISAFYAGIAGGLYALWIGFINPIPFDFIMSVIFLAMVVVGGIGTIPGVVAGAVVISYMELNLTREAIVQMPVVGEFIVYISGTFMDMGGIANISYIVFGIIIILIVVFEPLGLYGFWIRIKKYWKTWPF